MLEKDEDQLDWSSVRNEEVRHKSEEKAHPTYKKKQKS